MTYSRFSTGKILLTADVLKG